MGRRAARTARCTHLNLVSGAVPGEEHRIRPDWARRFRIAHLGGPS